MAPDKRPVLCGLADAASISETGRARDLAGLAALIDHLAAGCEEKERRQLAALARRAERGSVTAGDVTAELDRLHGGPRNRTKRRPLPTISRPSRRASVAAAAVLAVAVLGWSILKPEGSGSSTPELSTVLSDSEPADAGPAGTGPAGRGGNRCRANRCRLNRCRVNRCRVNRRRVNRCRLNRRRVNRYGGNRCRINGCGGNQCRGGQPGAGTKQRRDHHVRRYGLLEREPHPSR